MTIPQNGAGEEPLYTLRDLVSVVRTRAVWAVSTGVLCIAAAIAAAFLMTPIYRASIVVVPVSVEKGATGLGGAIGQFGGLASLAGLNLDSKDLNVEEALAVLRSRQFLEAFVGDHELLPRLFPRALNADAKKWLVLIARQPTPARAVKLLNDRIVSVVRDKKTGLVSVSIDWKDRDEAAAWANELVARVNSEMRRRAMTNAAASISYLEHEREATQFVETRDAINRLIEAQIRQRMLATVTQEYAFRTVDRALPPDNDDVLRPKRAYLIAIGAFGGAGLGVVVALFVAVLNGDLKRLRPSRHVVQDAP